MVENNIVDNLEQSKQIIGDGWFKSAAKFKYIAALLMKYTIDEYSKLDIVQIGELIIDKRHKSNTGEDILGDEIDLDPTESGDRDDKNIRHDLVFSAKSLSDTKGLLNTITINFEIQGAKKPYNMLSRAVYYTSHLLKNTIHKGDDYDEIHKVYSIWFCNFTLEDEITMYPEIKDRAIHHYMMCRLYRDLHKSSLDPIGDLMEAVMVELPKLNTKETDHIYKLFYDTANCIPAIEEKTKISLSKFKEVTSMFDVAKELETVEARGETRGKTNGLLEAAQNLIESLKEKNPQKSYERLIKEAVSLLKLDNSMIGSLQKMYTNK